MPLTACHLPKRRIPLSLAGTVDNHSCLASLAGRRSSDIRQGLSYKPILPMHVRILVLHSYMYAWRGAHAYVYIRDKVRLGCGDATSPNSGSWSAPPRRSGLAGSGAGNRAGKRRPVGCWPRDVDGSIRADPREEAKKCMFRVGDGGLVMKTDAWTWVRGSVKTWRFKPRDVHRPAGRSGGRRTSPGVATPSPARLGPLFSAASESARIIVCTCDSPGALSCGLRKEKPALTISTPPSGSTRTRDARPSAAAPPLPSRPLTELLPDVGAHVVGPMST